MFWRKNEEKMIIMYLYFVFFLKNIILNLIVFEFWIDNIIF